jgi:hypothetical protein
MTALAKVLVCRSEYQHRSYKHRIGCTLSYSLRWLCITHIWGITLKGAAREPGVCDTPTPISLRSIIPPPSATGEVADGRWG